MSLQLPGGVRHIEMLGWELALLRRASTAAELLRTLLWPSTRHHCAGVGSAALQRALLLRPCTQSSCCGFLTACTCGYVGAEPVATGHMLQTSVRLIFFTVVACTMHNRLGFCTDQVHGQN